MIDVLRHAGYAIGCTTLDHGLETQDELCHAFAGLPPDVLLADLSDAADCLPLRHAGRLVQHIWGEDAPVPARLALLTHRHLAQPDLPAYTDDFLLPPYSPVEVVARLSLLSFRKLHITSGQRISVADIVLDLASGSAHNSAGHLLMLTPREYDLLRFLCVHQGRFFARDRLLDLVWGIDFEGGERTVDIHIRRLRAKLPPQAAEMLETRRGIGYGIHVAS